MDEYLRTLRLTSSICEPDSSFYGKPEQYIYTQTRHTVASVIRSSIMIGLIKALAFLILLHFTIAQSPLDSLALLCSNTENVTLNGTADAEFKQPSNNKIVACSDFKIIDFDTNQAGKLSIISTEAQIASEGHWEGIKPDQYRISLNFTNATHYEGALAIDVTVSLGTSRIFLHKAAKLNMDLRTINIQQRGCLPILTPICIESVGVAASQDFIIIQLSSQLVAETKYTIGIQRFRANIPFYNQYNKDSPSNGIFWSDADGAGSLRPGVPAALTTVFRLREARSAFPCLDHPRLKARFTLCIEHPDNQLSVSSTPIRSSIGGGGKGLGRKRTCFDSTPPISTYLFTFSLLHEYDTEQRLVDTDLVVELLVPKGQGVSYRWLYDAAIEPMRFMGGSTRFRYPLNRIGFVMVEPYPYAGVENFGQITLNAKLVKGPLPSVAGQVLVNHEIVHQWFGGVVTLTDWSEICVQEGLNAFYEWTLTARTIKPSVTSGQNVTVSDRARRVLEAFEDDYNPFIRDYQSNREIIDNCYGVPPLFFKTILDAFGEQTFYRLFADITTSFQFDNADLDAWDESLAQATGRTDLRNYLRSWFTLPGYPRLFISKDAESLQVSQAFSTGVRPIIVRVLESSTKGGQPGPPIVLDKQSITLPISDPDAAWFLISPDDDTSPVRKIYTLDHYVRFLYCNVSEPDCNIDPFSKTHDRRKVAGKDFCIALFEDRFPWGIDDETVFDADAWRVFFNSYIEKGELDPECECCLRSKEQLKGAGKACSKIWNAKCRNLRINRQLGRAFKVDEE